MLTCTSRRRGECAQTGRFVFRVSYKAFPEHFLKHGRIAPSFFSVNEIGAQKSNDHEEIIIGRSCCLHD